MCQDQQQAHRSLASVTVLPCPSTPTASGSQSLHCAPKTRLKNGRTREERKQGSDHRPSSPCHLPLKSRISMITLINYGPTSAACCHQQPISLALADGRVVPWGHRVARERVDASRAMCAARGPRRCRRAPSHQRHRFLVRVFLVHNYGAPPLTRADQPHGEEDNPCYDGQGVGPVLLHPLPGVLG